MAQKERDNIELESKDRGRDQNGPRLPDKRPKLSVWIYLAIFVALLVHFFIVMDGPEANDVSYSTFLEYVEQGYVDEVTIINDNRIRGTYTQEAVDEGLVQVGEPAEHVALDARLPEVLEHRLDEVVREARAAEEVSPGALRAQADTRTLSPLRSPVD